MALLAIVELLDPVTTSYAWRRSDASAVTVTCPRAAEQSVGMRTFFGWRVVGAAFVLAVFGWGVGFYGPPVFLGVIHEARGWPLALVSTAVTVHFLTGAVAGGSLPAVYRRFGAAAASKAAALSLAAGILGWATASAPWQLFGAALLSGAGWAAMSAAAINGVVSPWFVRTRPAALAMAYNGGSIGGVVFSPLWVAAIDALGFPTAAAAIGLVMALAIWTLADLVFSRTPQQLGQTPDGDGAPVTTVASPAAKPLPGSLLWRDAKFVTLAAGMALGLFAQIGLVAHLFSLLTPALGAQRAGWAMGLAPALAIAGRTVMGWMMPAGVDRRLLACAGYATQCAGSIAFILAAGNSVPLLLLGIVLFGLGFGNATSLPPLIAQVEFDEGDVPRVVALIVAIAQGSYAFAPATFGLIREFAPPAADAATGAVPALFAAAALAQGLAIAAMLAGGR
jgi:Major Facilitator Superfamily